MLDPDKALRSDRQRAMKERTTAFARQAVLASRQATTTLDGRHLSGQLIRSSTSVAANYRAACRARSKKEFLAKIGLVLEEADESLFWLEFGQDTGVLSADTAGPLCREANELVTILTATRNTTSRHLAGQSSIRKSVNP
jgi:four helix bundle protein